MSYDEIRPIKSKNKSQDQKKEKNPFSDTVITHLCFPLSKQ